MALDHPERIERLAVLDVVPIAAAWDRADARFALAFWPWSLLALWSATGGLQSWYAGEGGPLAIWRDWAADVRGQAMPGGHFFPEELPEATAEAIGGFLRG